MKIMRNGIINLSRFLYLKSLDTLVEDASSILNSIMHRRYYFLTYDRRLLLSLLIATLKAGENLLTF